MGNYFCKRPETFPERALSYELLCDALTKWYGEQAFLAHVIYLDNLSTSFISEVVKWKLCVKRSSGYEYVELVLKTYPRTNARGLSFRSDIFFKNEIIFYENILPELLKFQNLRDVTEPFNNHLKLCVSYYDDRQTNKQDSIVFGDETVQGFANLNSKLDLDHGKLVLKILAKFHAISFAMKDQNPEVFDRISSEIGETYYSESYWGCYKKLWSKICAVAIDAVENEYPDTKYVDLIKKFACPSRFKGLIKAVNNIDNCVILHGDCSASNFMFKHLEDKPVDVKILDFQQTRCASPVLDVFTLLYNNPELLKNDEELLKHYFEVLSLQIRELGSNPDVYKWDVFRSEIEKYSYFSVAVSFETATTSLTAKDISDRQLALGWVRESKTKQNIADVYEVKNLEHKARVDLANNFVHCVDRGYIKGTLLESSMFYEYF